MATTSTPKRASARGRAAKDAADAEAVAAAFSAAPRAAGARHILVCGWRPVWTDEASRLHDRLDQLLEGARAGSVLCFANGLPPRTFRDLVVDACGMVETTDVEDDLEETPADARVYESAGGVRVEHVHGDAADASLLRKILDAVPIDTVIVLGTNARALGDPLSPKMCDTRVLNILLTIKHLRARSRWAAAPLHVIGENQIDETSMLALTPASGREPDFINTQAIYARALAISLAYPVMGAVIRELFDGKAATAIRLLAAGDVLPLDTPLAWGVARRAVALRAQTPGALVPLGVVRASQIHPELAIADADVLTFCADDRVAVVQK